MPYTAKFPLFLIPLLPLLGAAISLIFGRKMRRQSVHLVAVGSVVAACIVAVIAIFGHLVGDVSLWSLRSQMLGDGAANVPKLVDQAWTWIAAGDVNIPVGFMMDPLSAVMVLVVTFVGSMIHIYSCGYMGGDRDYGRYFGYLNLFTGAMLILVLADNLVLTFVGWEGVGLCSYLLIGFWYEKDANASAGKKAFIVNRIGDFGFILGMLMLWATVGTLDYAELNDASLRDALLNKTWYFFYQGVVNGRPDYLISIRPAFLVGLFLFVGATGKSAQLPLYVWLPDAMAGPTPVSALIHAATMVTAGVYMVARLNVLYAMVPVMMMVIAFVGAITALYSATIAFAQNDIKKVLAYSTVSQLGFMFTAVGVGAFGAGIFHLATHAFFKACLFMCSGVVIHALHEQQDIREMGGLRKKLPVAHWTFLLSTLAIAGLPIFSGFFSKDMAILGTLVNMMDKQTGVTMVQPGVARALSWTLYGILTVASMFTAFYMFRLYALTFLGENRTDPKTIEHLHTPSNSMRWPLIILAAGATLVGVLGLPGVMTGGTAWVFTVLALITAAALLWMAFRFVPDIDPEHGGQDPYTVNWLVRIPLTVIAAAVVVAGIWVIPAVGKALGQPIPAEWINHWLRPSIPSWPLITVHPSFAAEHGSSPYYHASHATEAWLMTVAVIAALAAGGAALYLYHKGPSKVVGSLVASMGWFYRLVRDKYRVDEAYNWLVIRPFTWCAWFLRTAIDEFVVDRLLVTGISYVVYGVGWLGTQIQTGRARQYMAAVLVGLAVLLFLVTRPLTGFQSRVQGNQVQVRAGETGDEVLGVTSGNYRLKVGYDFTGDGKVDRWTKRPGDPVSWTYEKPGKHPIRMVVQDPRFNTRSETVKSVDVKGRR